MVEGELTMRFSRAGIAIQRVNGKSWNRLWCQIEDGVKHVRSVRSVMIYPMETYSDQFNLRDECFQYMQKIKEHSQKCKLTWFVSVSEFKGVKKVEEFPDRNLKGIKQPHFGKDSVARLQSKQEYENLIHNHNKSFHWLIQLICLFHDSFSLTKKMRKTCSTLKQKRIKKRKQTNK